MLSMNEKLVKLSRDSKRCGARKPRQQKPNPEVMVGIFSSTGAMGSSSTQIILDVIPSASPGTSKKLPISVGDLTAKRSRCIAQGKHVMFNEEFQKVDDGHQYPNTYVFFF
jgi:hypothetical protein